MAVSRLAEVPPTREEGGRGCPDMRQICLIPIPRAFLPEANYTPPLISTGKPNGPQNEQGVVTPVGTVLTAETGDTIWVHRNSAVTP